MSVVRIDPAHPVPQGWDPDPGGEHQYRYWDGERWTDRVSDFGFESVGPLPEPGTDPPEATLKLVYLATGSTVPTCEVLAAADAVEALVARLRDLSRVDRRFRKREDVHRLAVEACRRIRELRHAAHVGVLVIPTPEIVVEVETTITWESDGAEPADLRAPVAEPRAGASSPVEPWGPLVRCRTEIDLAEAERIETAHGADDDRDELPTDSVAPDEGAVILDLFTGVRQSGVTESDDALVPEASGLAAAGGADGPAPNGGTEHEQEQGATTDAKSGEERREEQARGAVVEKNKVEKNKVEKKVEKKAEKKKVEKKAGKKKAGKKSADEAKVGREGEIVIDLTTLEAEEAEPTLVELSR